MCISSTIPATHNSLTIPERDVVLKFRLTHAFRTLVPFSAVLCRQSPRKVLIPIQEVLPFVSEEERAITHRGEREVLENEEEI
jgi:hypothetical protein